jgi:hypothetical protein
MELTQGVSLTERESRRLDLDTREAITLTEESRIDMNNVVKESFSRLEENDPSINLNNSNQVLTPPPEYPQLYSIFGGSGQTNDNYFSGDRQEFEPQGLRLLRLHF